MRDWRNWWETLYWLGQNDPPRLIESLMLILAVALLVAWQISDITRGLDKSWPYLVLSLSYAAGSSLSILVRETLISTSRNRLTQMTAIVLLLTSAYVFISVFIDLKYYL